MFENSKLLRVFKCRWSYSIYFFKISSRNSSETTLHVSIPYINSSPNNSSDCEYYTSIVTTIFYVVFKFWCCIFTFQSWVYVRRRIYRHSDFSTWTLAVHPFSWWVALVVWIHPLSLQDLLNVSFDFNFEYYSIWGPIFPLGCV